MELTIRTKDFNLPLNENELKEIETKIQSLSFPENFKNNKPAFNWYVSNLKEIYQSEITGFNKDYAERLKYNNHNMITPYVLNPNHI